MLQFCRNFIQEMLNAFLSRCYVNTIIIPHDLARFLTIFIYLKKIVHTWWSHLSKDFGGTVNTVSTYLHMVGTFNVGGHNRRRSEILFFPYHKFGYKTRSRLTTVAYDHTTMNTPVLVWSRKLSIVGPG